MSKRTMIETTVSIEQIEHALKIVAHVVAVHGEIYLPIFNRLHRELAKVKEEQMQKSIALELALSYCKTDKK